MYSRTCGGWVATTENDHHSFPDSVTHVSGPCEQRQRNKGQIICADIVQTKRQFFASTTRRTCVCTHIIIISQLFQSELLTHPHTCRTDKFITTALASRVQRFNRISMAYTKWLFNCLVSRFTCSRVHFALALCVCQLCPTEVRAVHSEPQSSHSVGSISAHCVRACVRACIHLHRIIICTSTRLQKESIFAKYEQL